MQTLNNLKIKLNKARDHAEKFEFATEPWECAMVEVRNLVDQINDMTKRQWSDKEWKEMMTR